MRRKGCSTLSADDAGRVLDRLAGLESIVSPSLIRQALQECARINERSCRLTHEVMLWVVLAMGLLTDLPIRQVFKWARRLRPTEKSPCRSSLCEARQRLGVEPVARLHELVVRPLATPETPGAFYKQFRWMAIDGTVLDVPESEANAQAFERSKGSRGEAAFPQVRKVSLVELGTHVEVALVIGGWQDSEQSLTPLLWDHIPADALLTKDRGFFSFQGWKELDSRGTALLFRVKSNLILKPMEWLPDGSYLAKIYATPWDRQTDRRGIVVRVIEYTLDDPQRTGKDERHRLLTNLLDCEKYPAMDLIVGYHERWEIELSFDEQKTHQDPRRAEKPTHVRSETPAGVRQELYALSLGHFVVRALMNEAAQQEQIDPRRLSFTGAFQILQCRLPEYGANPQLQTLAEWLDAVSSEILEERLPTRANRINPRVIKRKMSKWNKKRPCHRRPPKLTKTFRESVVMLN